MTSPKSPALSAGIFLIGILLFGSSATMASSAARENDANGVEISWNVRIPLRDGVHLNANIFRPSQQKQSLPCTFLLTPYTASNGQVAGMYLAENGYIFASIDARGRGDSEGTFVPLLQEANDGYDVVEWLAKQPFCTSKVAMLGGSYQGYDQWAALKEAPPHLATIMPVASAHPGVDFPSLRNMLLPYDVQWLTYTSGHTEQSAVFNDAKYWGQKYKELYSGERPLKDFDAIAGKTLPAFKTWIEHPNLDSYWDAFNPTAEQFKRMHVPILSLTGQYDDDQPGALAYYRDFFRYASEDAKASHFLVIGPWDHAGTRIPKESVGGINFGSASVLDVSKLRKEWFDWTLKSGDKPNFLKDKVSYYVLGKGAEEWRYAKSLEAVTRECRIVNLDSKGGNPTGIFSAGGMSAEPPTSNTPDVYSYDPNDERLSEQIDTVEHENWITDQRWLLNQSGNYFVYQTAPLDDDLEVAGFFKVSAWIALDQPDTDFHAQLFEIQPDGSSIFLTEDFIRARFRNSPRSPELVTPGRVLQYNFDQFQFVARRLQKGSRLRLTISPPAASPREGNYMGKNFNSGGVVAEETRDDGRVVKVSLYHDAEHRSTLSIPIAK